MSEKQKPGRNAPCPCGSGKKYKKCCYPDRTKAWKTAGLHESPAFVVKPATMPEPITHFWVSSDSGKNWNPHPGTLVMRGIGRAPQNIDETINSIIEPISNQIGGLSLSDVNKQDLIKCIHNIDHKLHAVKYHLKNYKQAEDDKIKEFNSDYKPPTGMQVVIEEPRLIYEVEAFLFQTKSCLDVLSRVLKPTFCLTSYCSFGEEGDGVISILKNNCPRRLVSQAEKIIKLIEDAQDIWIVELIKMRNDITHYSKLSGLNCFMEDPYIGGGTANIHYPTMPNKRRVLEYCQDIWEKLLSFCSDFLRYSIEAVEVQGEL